ncbi:MAG: four helix bundle protein [Gemmatimonadota bacterium]
METLFDHERLEVYRVARQFNRELHHLLDTLPRGHADSKNQLKRAGKSVTRNLAEGSGKWTLKDKIHYYHIARGSATECAAELDSLTDYGALNEAQARPVKRLLSRIVAMLVRMIRSLEERQGPDMGASASA